MAEKARTPMARVVSRQTIVRTAEDFAKTGADACPGIQFIHVSKTEVEESMGDLDDLAFSGARHLSGIRNADLEFVATVATGGHVKFLLAV